MQGGLLPSYGKVKLDDLGHIDAQSNALSDR
jgi:hypothetical protein